MKGSTFVWVLFAVWVAACGPGKSKTDKGSSGTYRPQSICPLGTADEPIALTSAYRTANHDGGDSDLHLEWGISRQTLYVCGGTWNFPLWVTNTSQHSAAERVWFTVIFYRGNEYVEDWSIGPMGITIPVGASRTFDFQVSLDDAFSSALDREVVASVIIQTDNPNYSDPDAFFTRTWMRLLTASDCNGDPAAAQPPLQGLAVHSFTCQDHTVLLQTHTSLMDGWPHAEVMEGDISLNGDIYQVGNFLYQSIHIDDIDSASPGRVDLLSTEEDRVRFYFRERVDCAWLPKTPPGQDPGDGDPLPPPDPNDDPDDSPQPPQPRQTRIEEFAALSACGFGGDHFVPPLAAPVSGKAATEVRPDGSTLLVFELANLPDRDTLLGEAWLDDASEAVYQVWLTRRVGAGVLYVPMAVVTPPADGTARVRFAIDPAALKPVSSRTVWLQAEGEFRPYEVGRMALKDFDAVVVTVQDADRNLAPSNTAIAGGSR